MPVNLMCPECGSLTRNHCPTTNPGTCPWRVCQRKACSAVLNFSRGRGYTMKGSTALPIRWRTA
jgi:hypothetical protein